MSGYSPILELGDAPMPDTMTTREKVARIVDPKGWQIRDHQFSEIDRLYQNDPAFLPEGPRQSAQTYVAPSLAKADAILAALASSGDHAELALMASAALEIYSDDVLVVGGTRRIHADNIILYVKNGVDALIAEVAARRAQNDVLHAERLGLRSAIFGSDDHDPFLRHASFIEMARTTEDARKGALARATEAERKLAEAVEVGLSIYIYANDTLSGRTDGPDDREWQRAAIVEIRNRARVFRSKEAERG